MKLALLFVFGFTQVVCAQPLIEQDFDVPGSGTPFELINALVDMQSVNLSNSSGTPPVIGSLIFTETPIPDTTASWTLDFDFLMEPVPPGCSGAVPRNRNARQVGLSGTGLARVAQFNS